MFKDIQSAQKFVNDKNIRAIDLKFIDLWGRWHHVTISNDEFSPNLMITGIGFDGSSVGFKSVKSGDMVLIPDMSTGFLDPFWNEATLSFICTVAEADSKQTYNQDPRQILIRSEEYLKTSGIADTSMWGPEFEFYIFSSVNYKNTTNCSRYSVNSPEAFWNAEKNSLGYFIPKHGGYHMIPPGDHFFNLRSEIVKELSQSGVPVKYHHHEVGGPGQCEIETPIMPAKQAADASMLIKYIVKNVANRNNLSATFLPKPLFGEAGSGMHFHQQLFKNELNVFFAKDGEYLLSQVARFYIGGLLEHAPAVLAFTNPSTNSYRRLIPGFEAPVNCFYSKGNRSAAIRVPKYATQANEVRFEFRPPDATCNPYLAMAAMLMAGIDGIRRKIDPTAAGYGPIDDDIFSWTDQQRKSIKSLPSSLGEAMTALENDHAFLLEGNVFDKQTLETWILQKRKEELEVTSRPHPYEVQLYYDL